MKKDQVQAALVEIGKKIRSLCESEPPQIPFTAVGQAIDVH